MIHVVNLVSGKNGTGKNVTVKLAHAGNNGTNGKVGRNGAFLILGFGVRKILSLRGFCNSKLCIYRSSVAL